MLAARRTRLLLGSFSVGILLILYAPLLVPIVLSFFSIRGGLVNWSDPNLSAYVQLMNDHGIIVALENTLIVGVAAIVSSLAVGTFLSVYYVWGGSRGRELLQLMVFLPFLLPPIITGLSLLTFFREIGLARSLLTVIIGHTVFVLALVYRTVRDRLASLGANLTEASYDLGASGLQTFYFIVLPNLASALVSAGILAFALSFDETMITILVTGTDNTLPMRLWAMMRMGFTPDINALVTIVLTATGVICILFAGRFIPNRLDAVD